MSLSAQECVCSFIDVSVVILEDLPSEISIDVTHHRHKGVDHFVEWIYAIAAGRCCHPKLRTGVVVVVGVIFCARRFLRKFERWRTVSL